jgi:hypothetical protein
VGDPPGNPWLVLIHQLPPKPPYLRVKVWRRLQTIGSVPIKNSVYVLPNTEEAREDFELVCPVGLSITCFRYVPAIPSHIDAQRQLITLGGRQSAVATNLQRLCNRIRLIRRVNRSDGEQTRHENDAQQSHEILLQELSF